MALLEKLNKLTAQNIFLDDNTGGKGRYYKSRFLQPGLVKYSFGVCVLSKETIDKFVDGFVGCPVIINHKDVTNENAKEERVGVISRVWYDEKDGWFWCEGVIFEEEAISLIEDGYNVSCQYEITEYSNNTTKALHNGNPYDKVILNGKPEHLAIVKTPRYESAMIAVNAIDLTAENEDRWITVHPHGEDSEDYRRLKIQDGESVEDAMHRQGWYEKRKAKETQKKVEIKEDELITSPEDLKEVAEKKGVQKREVTPEDIGLKENTIDQYLSDKSEKGWLYESKGTSTYTNGSRSAEVEEFGKDGGKYRVVFYDNNKRKDIKVYSTKRGMEKTVREHLQGNPNKETKALETKTNLEEKENRYKEVLKRYKENDAKRWSSGLTTQEYYKAYDEAEKAKKELTVARREYAESIMANFVESGDTSYEDKQDARRERYEDLSQRAATESERAHQQFRDKMSVIPFGQPIHGAKDQRYRDRAWDTLGRAVKLNEKSDYYASKAGSVGKAGISADDVNAIAKLAKKYKSGVDSAEKRRIIDRVIDIHKNRQKAGDAPKQTDYSDLGFQVERNSDINRLQLKFPGKPDENVRSILKHNGFRWSPREGAWQRQLNGNAESGLNRVIESLKSKNAIIQAINELKENNMFNKLFKKKEKQMDKDELKSLFMDCIQDVLRAQNEAEDEDIDEKDAENEEDEKEEKAENKKACNEDKRKLIDEVAGMMKSAGCDDEVIRTAIAKMEKIGYEKSEAGTADNCGKKGKNEEVEVEEKEEKEEVANKAKNSIEALKGLLSSGEVSKPASKYITKSQAIELGNQLF